MFYHYWVYKSVIYCVRIGVMTFITVPSKLQKLYNLTIKDTTVTLPVAQGALGDNTSLAKLFVRTRFPHRSRIPTLSFLDRHIQSICYSIRCFDILYAKFNLFSSVCHCNIRN